VGNFAQAVRELWDNVRRLFRHRAGRPPAPQRRQAGLRWRSPAARLLSLLMQ